MSLLSTIAHEGAARPSGFSLKVFGMLAAGLVILVGVGFAIVNNQTLAEQSAPAASASTGLAYDEFVRLNTTALEGLAPAPSVAAVESQVAADRFFEINTTGLEGLTAAAVASVVPVDRFIEINTTGLDGLSPASTYSERANGPR